MGRRGGNSVPSRRFIRRRVGQAAEAPFPAKPEDGTAIPAEISASSARYAGRVELIALLAMMMALSALSIDLMLPAFADIRVAFGFSPNSANTAVIVTAYMIGLAIAHPFYGPFADRFGRRRVIFVGLVICAIGAIGAATATTFWMLLASRVIWGIGAAGPRLLSLAIVRDVYEGERMARAMSFLMAVFVVVPVFAPAIGAGLVAVANWRAVFWFFVVYVAAIAMWTTRLPETLDPGHRLRLNLAGIAGAFRTVVTNRQTMAYALAWTCLFGVFLSYLASSERIVWSVFGLGPRFPLIFGGMGLLMGAASLANAGLVGRFGVRSVVRPALFSYVVAAAFLVTVGAVTSGRPGFWLFAPGLAMVLALYALLIPNLNTMAMAPMGHIAGTASGIIGAIQTGVGALVGLVVDHAYNDTVTPLSIGFLATGLLAFGVIHLVAGSKVPGGD
jgi:DHA1 family bicyclomycin/chloramphenicol resistance-like MFS transporter